MADIGRKKVGGRTKGTPNKKTTHLQETADLLSVDPFAYLLLIIKGDWKTLKVSPEQITLDLRFKATSEACQYLYPKRKAIEIFDHGAALGEDPMPDVSDEELDAM